MGKELGTWDSGAWVPIGMTSGGCLNSFLKLMSLRDYAKGHCDENQDVQRDRHMSHPGLSTNGLGVSSDTEGVLAQHPTAPSQERTRES